MAITTASAKDKGRRLQKWVGEQLSQITGFSFGPDEPIASREMGQNGVDIRLVGDEVRQLVPFDIECKNQQSWAIPAWIKQAKENQIEGRDWLLIVKKNHCRPIIIMDASRFFRWWGRWIELNRK